MMVLSEKKKILFLRVFSTNKEIARLTEAFILFSIFLDIAGNSTPVGHYPNPFLTLRSKTKLYLTSPDLYNSEEL